MVSIGVILIMDSTIYKERNDRPANEKDSAYLATFSSSSRRARCAARGLVVIVMRIMKSPLRSSWVYPCSHVVIMSWPCRQVFTTGMSCGIQGIIAACESWSWSSSWFGMGSDRRTTHDVGMHMCTSWHAHIKSSS